MRGLRALAQCLRVSRNHLAKHCNGPVEEVSPLLPRVFHRQLTDIGRHYTGYAYNSVSSTKLWSGFAKQCTKHGDGRPLFGNAAALHGPRLTTQGLSGSALRIARTKATLAAPRPSILREVAQHSQVAGPATLGEGLSRGAQKAVAWWLGGCAAWVFSMVVLGGLTRLTRSGLSMTDWKFTGERPPSSQDDWEAEFAKYKASPEYQRVNRGMDLEEFKFIYWMEYAHRMWGRMLGLVYAGPALYFAARGFINRPLAQRLGLLFIMGGTQGLVGWWMVRSGLEKPTKDYETPRVSPYRLAAHLGSAFLIYSILLWTSVSLAVPVSPAADPATRAIQVTGAAALRRWALPLAALIAVTGMSGAFVAGMDAGHAYNTFPLMEERLIPEEYWAMPGWRNAFENTAAVQFHHRVLALSTLTAVGATWLLHRSTPLPRSSRLLLSGLLAVTGLQVTLGITTLLTYVPASLGAAHQATALTLFSVALALLHTLRRSPKAPSPALRFAMPAAATTVLLVGAAVTQLN